MSQREAHIQLVALHRIVQESFKTLGTCPAAIGHLSLGTSVTQVRPSHYSRHLLVPITYSSITRSSGCFR